MSTEIDAIIALYRELLNGDMAIRTGTRKGTEMKTAMQRVFERITDEQAHLVWEMVTGFEEDIEAHGVEIEPAKLASATALREALDAAFASYAEVK